MVIYKVQRSITTVNFKSTVKRHILKLFEIVIESLMRNAG